MGTILLKKLRIGDRLQLLGPRRLQDRNPHPRMEQGVRKADSKEIPLEGPARLRLLVSTAEAVLTHDDPYRLLGRIFELLSGYCGLEVCFSFWVSNGRLRLAYCTGVSEEVAFKLQWLDFGQAVCGTVARDRCRITCQDVQQSSDPLTEAIRSIGIQAYACHPLIARGRLIGTLSYGTRRRPSFTDEELSVMQAVSDQVAVAIDRLLLIRTLEERNCSLAKSNTALEQFAYAAVHDLQEPIRTVMLYTQLLSRERRGRTTEREAGIMRELQASAEHMRFLVAGLHEYARVGTEDNSDCVADAGEAFEVARTTLTDAITRAGAQVTAEPLPVLPMRREHLLQVFLNLLGNAIKYARRGSAPQVHVSAARNTNDGWILSVQDNGVGVKPEYQDQIFGMFKRLHGRDVPGAGMGLAICRHVVEQYGGRIWVQSEPEHGATFMFSVPTRADRRVEFGLAQHA